MKRTTQNPILIFIYSIDPHITYINTICVRLTCVLRAQVKKFKKEILNKFCIENINC